MCKIRVYHSTRNNVHAAFYDDGDEFYSKAHAISALAAEGYYEAHVFEEPEHTDRSVTSVLNDLFRRTNFVDADDRNNPFFSKLNHRNRSSMVGDIFHVEGDGFYIVAPLRFDILSDDSLEVNPGVGHWADP